MGSPALLATAVLLIAAEADLAAALAVTASLAFTLA